jgi:hypothetical protein
MHVLNDSFAGRTASDAANVPFRFNLHKSTYTLNQRWYTVVPGKVEREMKAALYEGDGLHAGLLHEHVHAGSGGLDERRVARLQSRGRRLTHSVPTMATGGTRTRCGRTSQGTSRRSS